MSIHSEPVMTVADLDLMPDDGNRYEVIEGELFVSHAPSLLHQRITMNLIASLLPYLNEHAIGEIVPAPGVMFNDISGVIPDLVYISHARRDEIATEERITGAPDLVIEIVSPGPKNERRDRIEQHSLELVATLTMQDELRSPLLPGYAGKVERFFLTMGDDARVNT